MEKIVATTDFSANSKAGIRYAMQLSRLRKADLTFLHVHQVLRASFWSDRQYRYYIDRSKETLMREFPGFIKGIYRSMSITPPDNIQLAVHHNLDVVEGIVEYALREKASYICISTRGAGAVRKLLGTTAGKLIRTSPIPILCIPSTYRIKPVKNILYASDMTGYETELPDIIAFARPLNASVEMLHLSHPYELLIDKDLFKENLNKKAGYPVKLHYKSRDVEQSLMDEIKNAVNQSKPSVLAMFTHQDRSLFERLLLPGNANEYSSYAAIPLLSFPKSKVAAAKRVERPVSDGSKKKAKKPEYENK